MTDEVQRNHVKVTNRQLWIMRRASTCMLADLTVRHLPPLGGTDEVRLSLRLVRPIVSGGRGQRFLDGFWGRYSRALEYYTSNDRRRRGSVISALRSRSVAVSVSK